MVVLVARVCPGGTEYGAVDSPGGPQFILGGGGGGGDC